MHAFPPEVPEIVRAERKDESLVEQLQGEVGQVLLGLLGARWLTQHAGTVAGAVRATYYTLTTVAGSQSIGEEYVGVVPAHNGQVPRLWRRLGFVLFGCVLSRQLLSTALHTLERRIGRLQFSQPPQQQAQQNWLRLIVLVRSHLDTLQRLHLAVFFLQGAYYDLSRRLFGLQYVSIRPQTSGAQSLRWLRWLGVLSLLQIGAGLAAWLYASCLPQGDAAAADRMSSSAEPIVLDRYKHFKCSICLTEGVCPTCTPCGHISCWQCLLSQLDACPLCRTPFTPEQCVPIYNL